MVTDAQVRKLMEELTRHGTIGKAAVKAAMSRRTAARYLKAGRLPSELRKPHLWRTREDPFDPEDWAEVIARLKAAPELEAQALFDDLRADEILASIARFAQRTSDVNQRQLMCRTKETGDWHP